MIEMNEDKELNTNRAAICLCAGVVNELYQSLHSDEYLKSFCLRGKSKHAVEWSALSEEQKRQIRISVLNEFNILHKKLKGPKDE